MTGPVLRWALSLRKQLRQVTHQRDELAELVTNLRIDIAALELINAELMRSCPTNAAELTDG